MSMQGCVQNPSVLKCSCCNFHPKDRLNFVEMLLNNCLRCGHYHVDHRMTKNFDETTSQQQLNATEFECDRTVSKEIGQYFELLLLDHNDKDKNGDKTKEIQDLAIRAIQTYKERLKCKLEEPDESKYKFLLFKGCFKIKNGINALKKGKYGKSIYIFKMIIKKEFRNSKKARAKELLKLVGIILENLKVLVNDSSNDLNLTIEIIKLLESINGYDKYQYDNPLVFILRYQKELEQYKNKTPSTTKDPKPSYRLRIMILPDKVKILSFNKL